MALLQQILEWSESDLNLWQRDAMRRLFEQPGGVSQQDLSELYVLLRHEHGITAAPPLVAIPFSSQTIPNATSPGDPVKLLALHTLTDVNRLRPTERLTFAPEGLTVIYGGNGSGKSGYSRVLKKACRARDVTEVVLPDIRTNPSSVPTAMIDVDNNGKTDSLFWKHREIPPPSLSEISVFDARCARQYVNAESEAAYIPYGLDIVQDLAGKVMPALAVTLEQEIRGLDTDVSGYASVFGDTALGRLLSKLTHRTKDNEFAPFGALTSAEMARMELLTRNLAETDIDGKVKALRQAVARYRALNERLSQATGLTTAENVAKLRGLSDDVVRTSMAERLAEQQLRASDSLLEGTGGAAWKALFEAARAFAEASHHDHLFPSAESAARCMLCQQDLSSTAGTRMQRFDAYVKDSTAQSAATARDALVAEQTRITGAKVSGVMANDLEEELLATAAELPALIKTFEESLARRRDAILAASVSNDWSGLPDNADDPRPALSQLIDRVQLEASGLESLKDEAARQQQKSELADLEARRSYEPLRDSIMHLLERIRLKNKLISCRADLNTRAISIAAGEFANRFITQALSDALNEEFDALGLKARASLKSKTTKGKPQYWLALDFSTSAALESVLSEGEQRALAIAAFMAELCLARNAGGIVFDDPVSSLDHWRRRSVAKRLVKESRNRQVIVFTHDSVMLSELKTEASDAGLPVIYQHLEWKDDAPGTVESGLPWEHQGCDQRFDTLEKQYKKLEKLPWPEYPNEAQRMQVRSLYDGLRSTLERVVEEVVLNGIVAHHTDWVRVDRLEGVAILTREDAEELQKVYKKCHVWITGHDQSSPHNAAVPTPSEFGSDLETLRAFVQTFKDRRRLAKLSDSKR